MKNTFPVTPPIYFRTLNILFMVLLSGLIIFAIVLIAITRVNVPDAQTGNRDDIWVWLMSGLAIVSIVLSRGLFLSRVKLLREKAGLHEKLRGYQAASILRYAIMEGPGIFALIVFFLTGRYIFLGAALAIIVAFMMSRPSKAALVAHLQLHDDERMILDDPGAVLYENEDPKEQ